MAKSESINRDAGDKLKGPRLQKLRALELLLKALSSSDATYAYVATEFEGDVSSHTSSPESCNTYVEEDKNYAKHSSFTVASTQVLNTLVIFFDAWIKWHCSEKVRFCFYCPNEVGKEKPSARTKTLGIDWPKTPVLEILSSEETLEEGLLDDLSKLVTDEYQSQYPDGKGNYSLIELWTRDQWSSFFQKISWRFGQADDKALKITLLDAIRQCPDFKQCHDGKEELIMRTTLDLLDERQALSEPTERFVNASDLRLVFHEVATGVAKLVDPAWEMWSQLPAPEDVRNIADKVHAVSTSITPRQIGNWSRKAASGFNTQNAYGTDKSVLALKYRVYMTCCDRWHEIVGKSNERSFAYAELSKLVGHLTSHCVDTIASLAEDHPYTLSNKEFISELIWVLIDECYLSFDAEPSA